MKAIKIYRTAARLVLGTAMAGNLLALPLASQAATYSYTDLNPSGFTVSYGQGISGSQQVGYGYDPATGVYLHALLWSGTASNVVDLNPSGFTESFGGGISGSQQVGAGYVSATGNTFHALLWSGTASSVVDLNPSGFAKSIGLGISGSQQVGWGSGPATGDNAHALLWSGTASSVVDLNPGGFTQSYGLGISGSQQVGYGYGPATGGIYIRHALLWSGTASSVVDLHSFLPSDYSASVAQGIDANGNIVGTAAYIPTGLDHAMLWMVLPKSVVICNDPGQCGAVWTYERAGGSFPLQVAADGSFTVEDVLPGRYRLNVVLADSLYIAGDSSNPLGRFGRKILASLREDVLVPGEQDNSTPVDLGTFSAMPNPSAQK